MNNILVATKLFPQLFSSEIKITIPEYQRPYEWGDDKAEDLLEDFKDFFIKNNSSGYYYMGALLFYNGSENQSLEVIDGQQRITTLLIIRNILFGKLPDEQNIIYNAHQSIRFIKKAKEFFQQHTQLLNSLQEKEFMNRLQFTTIVTDDEDDAFTFFDTQNTRGIKLGATDFLKAYHLRSVKSIFLQELCAKKWEKASAKNNEGSFLTFLFEKILWRSRNWKGQNNLIFENKDLLLKTFQKYSIKVGTEDNYPLYSNFQNRRAILQSWFDDGQFTNINAAEIKTTDSELPFNLRQPLHKGMNFFKYTEKYSAIYVDLFLSSSDNPVLKNVRAFYDTIYTLDMSVYLRHFMQLCLVMYFDIFGMERLLDAIKVFDYLIGSVRLEKQQVKREATIKLLKDDDYPNNLLDVIAQSYLPDEIFDFIYSLKRPSWIYKKDETVVNTGVAGRYKYRMLEYYNKSADQLKERKSW
jgi:hypothetical protein